MDAEIITGEAVFVLAGFPANSIDLTVTSPPYDNLRAYRGYNFDFAALAQQLFRVTKPGGVVVWVVADATVDGSETGTSFRQALYFRDVCGFNLHDTMIYRQLGTGAKGSNLSYWQTFEFMFVLSKGRPKTVSRLRDKPNKQAGRRASTGAKQAAVGTRQYAQGGRVVAEYGIRENVWEYLSGNNGDDITAHPAPFPEKLARDHILSWSAEGDLVLDPLCGSGTTGKQAVLLNRRFVGVDIAAEYCAIAAQRIQSITGGLRDRLREVVG
jgi:site-specific DNA-methyltransferase (adenine-specific)